MILPLIKYQFKLLTIMADKSIETDFLKEDDNNIPVKQRKTNEGNYHKGDYVNPHGSVLDEEQPLDLSINKKQVQTIYHPQNNGAKTPSGRHPFIQQQGHTTLQPALQQQQQQRQQQHSIKGKNEQCTAHRYTVHRNDASMPFQRPKFDQFMTPSNLVANPYSCSRFPIMAKKREYYGSIGENENIILAKCPKTNVHTDPLCTSVNNQDLSGDENGRLDSGNDKDPLSNLTKDQRVVLYTMLLGQDSLGDVYMRDADCVGDIVWKIVKELENKGLVEHSRFQYKRIPDDKQSMIMKSYRENCLLSEIDKDFFIQVASDESIRTYAEMYCRHGDGSRESEDIGPITAMRLVVEGHGRRLPDSVTGEVPACLINDEKELEMFVKFWCKARNTDPITLSDQIPVKKVKNFYSAFTILSEMKNELMEMHLSKKKWSILISILLSERYSGCENIRWEENRKIIQQIFKALQDVNQERAEEDFVLLKELEHRDELLNVDKEKNKVTLVSEEVRHQVMSYFVLNCLQSKEDYENYLDLSSVDSLFEYVRPLGYSRQSKERCIYLPKGTEELFVRRIGIDAIRYATSGYEELANAILSELKIPPVVFEMSQGTKNKFCNFVKGFDEEHEHQLLNRSSLFGSFLIDLNTSEKKGFFTLPLSSPKMSILCTILLSNNYTLCLDKKLKDTIKETRQTFSTFQSIETVDDDLLIKELVDNDKLLLRSDVLNNVQFATDDVRHHVMSYFVRTCLITDEDYINYFNLSSVDSLLEYVCEWGDKNLEEKRCLHLPERIANKYVKRLDVYMFCHVNPLMIYKHNTDLVDKLKVPPAVLEITPGTKNKFCNFIKGFYEEHEHHQLNRNSLFGSFLIELNTSEKRDFFTSPLSLQKMSILCTILLSNGYALCLDNQWKDRMKATRQTFKAFQSNETVEDDLLIKELVDDDKVLIKNIELNNVQFATDDDRHHVMSYFVRTCLVTDEDYINYFNLSSVDSLLEYVCHWQHKNVEGRCLHLPEGIANKYVERLDVYMFCHVNPKMLCQNLRDLADKFHIPIEVLDWDCEARRRYVECLKKGTQIVHRTRAMIVGCAGAGKTTLLERLQNHNIDKLKEIESTVGLEVHENIFEVENKSLRAVQRDT